MEKSFIGVKVNSGEDFIEIDASVRNQDEVTFDTYNDHRMAMMLAIAATVAKEPVIIDNKECVKKSYPGFFDDFVSLGGKIDGSDL